MTSLPKLTWRACALIAVAGLAARAWAADCNAASPSPSVTIAVPGPPFAVAAAPDGCWLFVSTVGGGGNKAGIAVLRRADGRIELSHAVPISPPAALGMVLTHDGRLLVVAASNAVVFLDVGRMTSGAADPVLGSFSDGSGAGSVYANVSADDKLLFVSDEGSHAITVIDMDRARANGYKAGAIIGRIPAGNAPIALTFSPDGKWLYTTSEIALSEWHWPNACKPEGGDPAKSGITSPEGAVVVVDVARAKSDPAQAVVARVPAGCSPVRLAMSADGGRIYVTARNSDAVLAFDTAKLVSDGGHAKLGSVPVGPAPVPIAVIDHGRKLIVGNSNRFAGSNQPQSLTVLDAAKMTEGAAATLGTVPAGAFPREMAVSADGRTLFLTNYGSKSLQAIDVEHLPLAK